MAIIDEFLASILKFLQTKDGLQLRLFLRVEPPLPDQFMQLSQEMKQLYPKVQQEGVDGRNAKLDMHIEKLIPIPDDDETSGAWAGFQIFMREYLKFWRDVDFDDLLATHTLLNETTNACITALSHATHGILVMQVTVQLCSSLARLAMMLDKRPDLTQHVRKVADEGERKTLVESTAETIQRAFTICLTERTQNKSGVSRDGNPEGKKVAIYLFANMVLKLLYQCRKPRLASQIFTNILQNSPPLAIFPASQRVTYLYYLGRYHLATNHFYYASRCFQSAYDQCHAQCLKHRRTILIYLITSNMILGRFPSRAFFSRPEATDIIPRFVPIMKAIQKGDMVAFKQALGPESRNQQWFFQKGVLLSLQSRCEVLVWRSLARRTFLLTYQFPADANSRKAPTLDILNLVTAAQYCQKILEGWTRPVDSITATQSGRSHPNALFMKMPDLIPPPEGPKRLGSQDGVIYGNRKPNVSQIEAIVASLIQQGLMHGFLSHTQGKFAIIGSKQRGGPLKAGFPNVWEVLNGKAQRENKETEIPGWVQKERVRMGGVVNLSGARPVGSGD